MIHKPFHAAVCSGSEMRNEHGQVPAIRATLNVLMIHGLHAELQTTHKKDAISYHPGSQTRWAEAEETHKPGLSTKADDDIQATDIDADVKAGHCQGKAHKQCSAC